MNQAICYRCPRMAWGNEGTAMLCTAHPDRPPIHRVLHDPRFCCPEKDGKGRPKAGCGMAMPVLAGETAAAHTRGSEASELLAAIDAAAEAGRPLGDAVKAQIERFGLDRLAKLWEETTGRPCNCESRQKWLNKHFPRGVRAKLAEWWGGTAAGRSPIAPGGE